MPLAVSNAGAATRTTVAKTTHDHHDADEPRAARPKSAHVRIYLADLVYVSHHAVTVPSRLISRRERVVPTSPASGSRSGLPRRHTCSRARTCSCQALQEPRLGHFSLRMLSPGAGTVRVTVTPPAHGAVRSASSDTGRSPCSTRTSASARGPDRRADPAAAGRAALLHPPDRGLRQRHRAWRSTPTTACSAGASPRPSTAATISELLNGVGSFQVRFPNHGTHVEGDLTDQLLALINGSKVYRIYPISSGKPSTPTILGALPGLLRRSPATCPTGCTTRDFFYGGYAIHGYDPAPDYPASHGCMRLPIVDAISVYNWLNIGDWVDVYYE